MKPRRMLLVVPDLFFATRIATAAKHAGVETVQASADTAVDAGRAQPCDLAVVDLDGAGDPVALVAALKRETPALRVVAFCRHTATEKIRAARQAGADQVLPRSVFFPGLAAILDSGGIHLPREAT